MTTCEVCSEIFGFNFDTGQVDPLRVGRFRLFDGTSIELLVTPRGLEMAVLGKKGSEAIHWTDPGEFHITSLGSLPVEEHRE